MNRISLIFILSTIIFSCNVPSKTEEETSEPVFTIEDVKTVLAKQDEIPSDSIHVVKLKESGLYITQGFGRVDNKIRLVKLSPDSFVVLDSIQTYQEIDIDRQKRITYDLTNDWFTYSDLSSGTGDFGKTVTLVRVENNHFSELFTYSKNASVVDVEAEDNIHLPFKSVEIKELEMNREKLVLETTFVSGVENTNPPNELKIKDTLTFEFSKPLHKFILKSSMDPILRKEFPIDKKGEYLFRI